MNIRQIAESDGICYKCHKHVMKDCECFFDRLFIDRDLGHDFVTAGCTDHRYCIKCGEEDHVIKLQTIKCSTPGNQCTS